MIEAVTEWVDGAPISERRRWSDEVKERAVVAALEPGVNVSALARHLGISPLPDPNVQRKRQRTGNGLANSLIRNADNNVLGGGISADTMTGDTGNDWLVGGSGKDHLTVGIGANQFVFKYHFDSDAGAVGRDVITDFNRTQGDKINLFAMDAKLRLGGNKRSSSWVLTAFQVLQANCATKKATDQL